MAQGQRYQRQFIPQDIPRGLQGLALANPLEDALGAVEKFAERSAVDRGRQQAADAVFGGEQVTPKLGLTPGGDAFNDAAQHAFAAKSEAVLRSKAATLEAQFSGLNPTDGEAFAEIYNRSAEEVIRSVPEQWRAPIALEAQLRGQMAVAGIQKKAIEHQRQLSAAALRDGFDLDIQDAASAEQIGQRDLADAAMAKAQAKAESLRGLGLINDDSMAIMLRNGREEVATRTLYRGFLDGRVSLEDVRDGEVGAHLSASARDRLVNRIQGEISDRRVAANHAMALQERDLRLRSQDATALAKKRDAGVPLSPDEQAREDSYATVPGLIDQDALDKVAVARATSGLSREVATATPQQIEATIAEWNTRPPGSLADVELRKRSIEAFEARQQALKDDPASYAAAVMPDKFPPVVLPPPSDPNFDAALQQAATNAATIRAQFGVEANPFTREQQQRLATELAGMPASEQAATLARIQANMGPAAATVHEGLAKDGALVQAHAGLVPAPIGASILQGQEQMKLGNVKAPTAAEASGELIGSGVAEAYAYSPGAQAQLRQAATARAAYLAAMAGDPAGASGYLSQAYKDVAGVTGNYNGRKIALPLGVEDLGAFSDRIESVTPQEVAAMGGVPDVAAALQAGEAALESIGNGQYLVTIGASRVNRPDGRPFVLDFSQIAEKSPNRLPLQFSAEAAGFDPSGR
jgi:hypothetical protein